MDRGGKGGGDGELAGLEDSAAAVSAGRGEGDPPAAEGWAPQPETSRLVIGLTRAFTGSTPAAVQKNADGVPSSPPPSSSAGAPFLFMPDAEEEAEAEVAAAA